MFLDFLKKIFLDILGGVRGSCLYIFFLKKSKNLQNWWGLDIGLKVGILAEIGYMLQECALYTFNPSNGEWRHVNSRGANDRIRLHHATFLPHNNLKVSTKMFLFQRFL